LQGESGNLSEVTWGFSPGTPAIITISSLLNLCSGVVQEILFMNGRTPGGGTIRQSLGIFAALILAFFSFLFITSWRLPL